MLPAKDGVKDREHYLLLCQSYEEPRCELLNGFNEILPPSDISYLSDPGTEPHVKRPFRRIAKRVAWSGIFKATSPDFNLTRPSLNSFA